MERISKITLEVSGLDELEGLLEVAMRQANELLATVDQINVARINIQAKINQPPAATDG